ncbi:hypothetical protein L0F51_13075 [Afifella sp. H1R]|uniref:hypothetical protein n=1 Tax=Afifella sp. H1R TaxID=2908841 RepID=UPI001F20F6DA|nr:hypothetical protein [Afifella sp. H1R]MCF1504681.1 hypothetical protein [Afifella sp. H1R]
MHNDTGSFLTHQYELLTILDGKASCLLSFNAILLAALSIWLGYIPLNFLHLSLDVVFILLLLSSLCLLRVIHLKWSDGDRTAPELDEARHIRSDYYLVAWRMTAAGTLIVILVSSIHTIGTALTAIDRCDGACARLFDQRVFGNLDYADR